MAESTGSKPKMIKPDRPAQPKKGGKGKPVPKTKPERCTAKPMKKHGGRGR